MAQPICPLRAQWQAETEIESPERPKLKFLHSEDLMNPVKLEVFRRLSTDAIKSSLHPGQPGSLKDEVGARLRRELVPGTLQRQSRWLCVPRCPLTWMLLGHTPLPFRGCVCSMPSELDIYC